MRLLEQLLHNLKDCNKHALFKKPNKRGQETQPSEVSLNQKASKKHGAINSQCKVLTTQRKTKHLNMKC